MRHAILALAIVVVSSAPAAADPAQCTPTSGCPKTYDVLFPYLTSFCTDKLSADELADVEALSDQGALHKEAVEVLLNVYGAMYGYEFKMLKHLNTFFYDKDAAKWLPANCTAKIKTKRAKEMPFELTKQRDHIRRFYDKHYPSKRTP